MKITIEGSPKEAAGLIKALLSGAEAEAKKPYFPPLLTELAEDEKINELAEAIQNVGKESAPQVEAAEHQDNQALSREEAKEIVKCMDTAAKEALKFQYHTP